MPIIRIALNHNSIERRDDLQRVLKDIENKDSTFIFNILGRFLYVSANDENQGHKRGLWLINKLHILNGHRYRIEEGELLRKE